MPFFKLPQYLNLVDRLRAIPLLRKKNSGWVGSSNANLHNINFGQILLIMWVDGFKNGKNYAYVIKVWPLTKA